MELIPITGAELYYNPHFFQTEEATQLFNTLLGKCAWERRKAAFGHDVPRDEAYYGDPGTHYSYRGDFTRRSLGYRNCSC
jgi:hypothetical protein